MAPERPAHCVVDWTQRRPAKEDLAVNISYGSANKRSQRSKAEVIATDHRHCENLLVIVLQGTEATKCQVLIESF